MVARFMNRDVCPPTLRNTAIALVLIFVPTLLVMAAQPDLGTSILIAASGILLSSAGMSWRLIYCRNTINCWIYSDTWFS